MKQALRRGDATSLNVYTVGFNDDPGLQGYATFPWNYADAPTNDGIVMFYGALPGGISPFNTGKVRRVHFAPVCFVIRVIDALSYMVQVLTHETGHWTGLYHTFQARPDNEEILLKALILSLAREAAMRLVGTLSLTPPPSRLRRKGVP